MKFLKCSKWVERMLVDGNLSVNGTQPQTENLIQAVHREGVLSLHVWFRMVKDLLKDLQKEGFLIYGYADDKTILAIGNFLNTPRDLMINAWRLYRNSVRPKI